MKFSELLDDFAIDEATMRVNDMRFGDVIHTVEIDMKEHLGTFDDVQEKLVLEFARLIQAGSDNQKFLADD